MTKPIMGAIALLLVSTGGAIAADPAREWSSSASGVTLDARIERRGKGEALVLSLRPGEGRRVEPPVLRIDAPALVQGRLSGKFPTTVRSESGGKGAAVRAILPLKAPGGVRFADPDSNDGALRIEFRACGAERRDCRVERMDIPVRAGARPPKPE